MPFYPWPGVGRHCTLLDSFYLLCAARAKGEGTRFVELAEAINSRMPQVVVSRVQDALNDHAKALRGSNVLVLGVAYKKNVRDFRESPAKEPLAGLQQHGAVVPYSDPHVPSLRAEGIDLDSVALDDKTVVTADCVLILADHDAFDLPLVAR